MIAGLLRRWFGDAPPERLAALRILVGSFATVFVVARSVYWLQVLSLPTYRWQPVGLLAPLSAPPPARLVLGAMALAVPIGAAFTAGWRFGWTAPTFAALLLGLTTYGNCWGQVFHAENLMTLHVAVLALVPGAADAWSADRRAGRARVEGLGGGTPLSYPLRHPLRGAGYAWPLCLVSAVTVIGYAIAGWAKLRLGGMAWITGDALRHQVAHDNLRKLLVGDVHSPLGGALVAYAWPWRPIGVFTVVAELGAPLFAAIAVLRRWWVVSVWILHVGILALMAIVFAYPLSGVAFASFFPLERGFRRLGDRLRKVRGPTRARLPRACRALSPGFVGDGEEGTSDRWTTRRRSRPVRFPMRQPG